MIAKTLFSKISGFDERRDISSPGPYEATIRFCAEHFIAVAKEAIELKGSFFVALAGGNTPKAVYSLLADPVFHQQIDWKKVHLYWSDERCVPPFHPDSNYRMAMEAGFGKFHLPPNQVHRMQAEGDVEEGALAYDKLLGAQIPNHSFDLVLLGMGEDGHTASLFPETHALRVESRWAVANYIPQKDVWRMTLTFECINNAKNIALYVTGKSKAQTLKAVFGEPYQPDRWPAQRIGTPTHKALWICDEEALRLL